mmetsp:Transcript_27082/g.65349  ORF Transcript_27082/g.65349 Transcript_27082/m.65349 type:complete len:248 (+) Transcript_27082:1045-1788(+)
MLPKKSFSAMRPPSIMHIVSTICSLVWSLRSFGTYCAYPSAAIPRGTIDTLSSGAACCRNQPTVACPASWCATRLLSSTVITLDFFSSPPITRSIAAWKSSIPTASFLCRAAISAPSLTTFAISAPENPGVSVESFLATSSNSSARRSLGRCTRKISARPLMSGAEISIVRSKRPGRISAGSRMSARLVPPITTMLPEEEKPSISTSSWLSVFSRSSLPPAIPPLPRARPTASISSIHTMQGCIDFA